MAPREKPLDPVIEAILANLTQPEKRQARDWLNQFLTPQQPTDKRYPTFKQPTTTHEEA